MPVKRFTARTVNSLNPTPGKRMEYFDAALPGLALRVTERGAKSWAVLYRHRGRLRRLTLADASVMSLSQARDRARVVLHDAANGADPAADKQLGRQAETMADLTELYLEKWAKPRKRSWKADDNLIRKKILPRWRNRAIVDVRRRDVRELVEAVAAAGAPVVANRVAALCSKMFAFALDHELVEANPAVRIPRPAREQQRDRVLTEDELRTLWAEFGALDVTMGTYYKLRLITAQRGGEVAVMRWQDLDLAAGWWTIPATSSKNKLAHRVPLSPTAIELITALKSTDVEVADYVLVGARGKRQQAEAAATFTVPDFRGHDLRRTAASIMASGGIGRLTISKILNHVERSVTAVYDRHSYDPEKQAALAWWEAKLTTILENKTATVHVFQRKGA